MELHRLSDKLHGFQKGLKTFQDVFIDLKGFNSFQKAFREDSK